MIAGQKSYGSNGLQNFLFPINQMYLTQGSYEATYSHNGCYAMDFQVFDENGRLITNAPIYAPCDLECVAIWGNEAPMVVWNSLEKVNFIDSTIDYACIGFVHEDNTRSRHQVGDIVLQGEVISHTGTMGTTADHIHIEAKKLHYDGYHQNTDGVWMLTNSTWLYQLFGVNDTELRHTYYINHNNVRVDYPWREFTNIRPDPIIEYRKQNFPWFIYQRKKRKGLKH